MFSSKRKSKPQHIDQLRRLSRTSSSMGPLQKPRTGQPSFKLFEDSNMVSEFDDMWVEIKKIEDNLPARIRQITASAIFEMGNRVKKAEDSLTQVADYVCQVGGKVKNMKHHQAVQDQEILRLHDLNLNVNRKLERTGIRVEELEERTGKVEQATEEMKFNMRDLQQQIVKIHAEIRTGGAGRGNGGGQTGQLDQDPQGFSTRPGHRRCAYCLKEMTKRYLPTHMLKVCKEAPHFQRLSTTL